MSADTRETKPAFVTDYARMWDLTRYARGYLLDNELITLEEYTALVSAETMGKPGQGSPSPRRLESYDELRAKASASAPLARVRALVEEWRSESKNIQEGRDYGYGLRMLGAALNVCADQLLTALGETAQETGEQP